jgi:hypothetical protein
MLGIKQLVLERTYDVYFISNVSIYVARIGRTVNPSQWGQCGEDKNLLPLDGIETQTLSWPSDKTAYSHTKFRASNATSISVHMADFG